MKIIDKYILKNFFGAFFFVLLLLSIIAIVIDFTEKIDSFIGKKVPAMDILKYYIVFIPYISALLFPLFVFIAVIFFTTRIAYRSEVIAMLNGGMSYNRFLQPYLIGGSILALIILYGNHITIPRANRLRLNFENKYINHNSVRADVDMHYRISKNEYIYLKTYNVTAKTGYNFAYEKIEDNKLLFKIIADQIAYDSITKSWKLIGVTTRVINKNNTESLTKDNVLYKKFAFKHTDLIEEHEMKQAMTTKSLNEFIAREKIKGNPGLNVYYVERYRRWVAPLSVIILTLIGAIIASRKVRGGSGIHLAIGLTISAAYVVFMQFSTTFSIKGSMHPLKLPIMSITYTA
jgi:lipopolysaccharide export system permease protein